MSQLSQHQLSQTLYAQLRNIAARHLRGERSGHSLQPTALVHEAFLRLRDGQSGQLSSHDRSMLLATAARQMRQVLIDHARRRDRLKRGGKGRQRFSLQSDDVVIPADPAGGVGGGGGLSQLDLLDLADALERLALFSPRQAEVVTLRYFGGMTNEELAAAIGVSVRSVESDWQFARAWLRRELGGGGRRE